MSWQGRWGSNGRCAIDPRSAADWLPDESLGQRAMAAAVPVTAVTEARYALPAAGATLAGKRFVYLSYALGAALRPDGARK